MRPAPHVALLAVLLASSALAESSFSLRVSHPAPSAGDVLYYRLAWKNTEATPVRVPVDALERVRFRPLWCINKVFCNRVGYGGTAKPAGLRPVPASALGWRTLAAGASIERFVRVETLLPKSCPGGRCRAGLYYINYYTPYRAISDKAPNQFDPGRFGGNLEHTLLPNVLPVTNDPRVTLRVDGMTLHPGSDKLIVTATVVNGMEHDIWFPKEGAIFVECPMQVVTKTGKTEGIEVGSGAGGQQPHDETEAFIVRKRGSHAITLRCDGPPRDARSALVTLRLVPFREFSPRDTRGVPLHWDSTISSAPYALTLP